MKLFSLQELTWDNLGEVPILIKGVLILLLSILLMVAGHQLVIQNHLEQRQMLHEQQIQLMDYFSQKQRSIATLPLVQRQVLVMQKQWENLLSDLPGNIELPQLIQELTRIGNECSVEFDTIAPMLPNKHSEYHALSVRLIIRGTYDHLAIFLSRLVRFSPALSFQNFTLTASGEEVQMAITIEIFGMDA